VRPIPAMRALIHIGQGLVDEAWDWASEHQVTAVTEPTYLNEFNLLTLARLLVATARSKDKSTEVQGMMPTLARLLEEAEAGGRMRSVVEILVTQALVLESLHNRVEALDSLARALTAGVPAGLLRPFLDAGEPLQSLLGEVAAPRPAGRPARHRSYPPVSPTGRPEDVPRAVELRWRPEGDQAASSLVGVTVVVASSAARSAGRCRWPLTLRNCRRASPIPAAIQRSTIWPSCQRLTLAA